jgi:hypothetical protein
MKYFLQGLWEALRSDLDFEVESRVSPDSQRRAVKTPDQTTESAADYTTFVRNELPLPASLTLNFRQETVNASSYAWHCWNN